jgi:Ca-activated chloride channel family protein
MQLSDPWWTALLILIPLLHRWWVRRNRPASFIFPFPMPRTVSSTAALWVPLLLKYIALAFFVFALARPQNAHKYTERSVNGIDILMVMDVSASMNIEDLAEQSRLEVAKHTMREFIKGRQNDRIGFVIFSGEAVTLSPPTLDYGVVLQNVGEIRTGALKDGTAIGDGLALAVGRLRESQAKSKVIILLTDGDNNVGQVDPATAGDLADGYGIKVYTIAVGREGRVKLPIRTQIAGQTVTTYQMFENALNPTLLEHIARLTNGKFYRVTDAKTLESVFKEIDQLETTKVQAKEHIRYDELFSEPLKWGVIFLILERLLSFGWWRIIP